MLLYAPARVLACAARQPLARGRKLSITGGGGYSSGSTDCSMIGSFLN
jgi:hypothetical protein